MKGDCLSRAVYFDPREKNWEMRPNRPIMVRLFSSGENKYLAKFRKCLFLE
jgi:hypothetical protein